MKTFHLGCRIDTNIPARELQYKIQIYHTRTERYIPFMNDMVKLPDNKEAYTIYHSQQDITKEEAGRYEIWLYIYRSWQASKPHLTAYTNLGSLQRFIDSKGYKQLKPLKVHESKAHTKKQESVQSPPTMTLNISRRSIFVTPEYPSEHPKDPFRKK